MEEFSWSFLCCLVVVITITIIIIPGKKVWSLLAVGKREKKRCFWYFDNFMLIEFYDFYLPVELCGVALWIRFQFAHALDILYFKHCLVGDNFSLWETFTLFIYLFIKIWISAVMFKTLSQTILFRSRHH